MQVTEGVVEAAWTAHRGPLVGRLTALTRNPDVAEDLAQEAFLRLTREVEAGRPPENPGAWLFRVGANLAASRGRHISVVDRRSGDLAVPHAPATPEAVAVESELAAALSTALQSLGSADRNALLLAAHGFRGPEIAATIGRSHGATRTLLCRARSKVRGSLMTAGFSPA
ncbi:MAG: sigma-70 family RNA polymerase sigma factor [Candidatus Limnocylindrales bacterium]